MFQDIYHDPTQIVNPIPITPHGARPLLDADPFILQRPTTVVYGTGMRMGPAVETSTMKLTIAMAIANIAVPPVASASVETNPRECIDPADYPADTDFFPEKFVPDETTDLLTVEYHGTYKIVTNKHVDKSYLLYQCGTEPPADEVESGKHHLVVSVPHEGGVSVTETPQIPLMELLGLRREVKAYIGNPKLSFARRWERRHALLRGRRVAVPQARGSQGRIRCRKARDDRPRRTVRRRKR